MPGKESAAVAITIVAALAVAAAVSGSAAHLTNPIRQRPAVAEPEPGLRVLAAHRFYGITGTTAAELRAAMNRQGPRDSGGRRFDANTSWWISWRYAYRRLGASCGIARASVQVRLELTFPRWRPGAAAAASLVRRWNSYLHALDTHENGHADDAVGAGRRILHGLPRLAARSSCTAIGRDADAFGAVEVRRANAWDVAYDRRTNHGATQGAVFP